jgi:hypothetical protein
MTLQVSARIQHGARKRPEITGTFQVNRTREGTALLLRGIARLRCPASTKPQVKLTNIEPGDRAPDQHPLDLRRALEDREDPGVHGKSHRHTRAGLPIAVRMGYRCPFHAFYDFLLSRARPAGGLPPAGSRVR